MKRAVSYIIVSGCIFSLLTGCATKRGAMAGSSDAGLSAESPVARQEDRPLNMKTSEIQMALKNAGYYEAKVDGIPGPKTRDAIRRFQADNDLVADSIAGPKTQKVLIKYLDKESSE